MGKFSQPFRHWDRDTLHPKPPVAFHALMLNRALRLNVVAARSFGD